MFTTIKNSFNFGFFFAGAMLVATVSGCAADSIESQSTDADALESDEAIGTSHEALVSPGGGIGYSANVQIKSRVGNFCVQNVGDAPVTRACSASAAQVFALYSLPDGTKQLCVPNTFKVQHLQGGDGQGAWSFDAASATCIHKSVFGGETTLDFRQLTMTVNGTKGTSDGLGDFDSKGKWIVMPFAQTISRELNGVLGWNYDLGPSGLKITRDSNGTVSLRPAVSNNTQRWSLIQK